jgi:hypothetical protein
MQRPAMERWASLAGRPARAELVWEGKYDAAGRRVAPLRVALPFQTVETVNESAQDRQRNLQFGPGFREEEWRNRLIWGGKKYVLPSLLPEFAGRVNLIYIDPPFDTGAIFHSRRQFPTTRILKKTTRSRLSRCRASLSTRRIAIRGVVGSNPIYNGFTKLQSCSTNCCTRQAVSMPMLSQISVIWFEWCWTKFLVRNRAEQKSVGRERHLTGM